MAACGDPPISKTLCEVGEVRAALVVEDGAVVRGRVAAGVAESAIAHVEPAWVLTCASTFPAEAVKLTVGPPPTAAVVSCAAGSRPVWLTARSHRRC